MNHRKSMLWKLGAIAVAAALLAACTQGGDNKQSDTKKLTVAAVAGVESDPLKEVLDQYEEKTGVSVDLVQLPYDGLYTKLQTDLAAKADTYDVIFMDDPWFPGFAGAGYLEDLGALGYDGSDEDFVKASFELGQWPTPGSPQWPDAKETSPKQYALPIVGNTQLFNYRVDLLKDKNLDPPSTWDDVLSIAGNFEGDTYGYVVRGANPPVVTNFAPIFYGYGGEWFDDNWRPAFNNQVGLEALERFLELAKHAPKGVGNFNADQLNETLINGDGVQAVNWPAWGPALEKSDFAGEFGYSVVPAQEGNESTPVMGNWLLSVPTASKHKESALEFIEWATSADTFRAMLDDAEGAVPTRTSVLEDTKLADDYPWFPALAESLPLARYWPRIPNFNEFFDIMGRHLNGALTGSEDPKKALDDAAAELEGAMERAGFVKN